MTNPPERPNPPASTLARSTSNSGPARPPLRGAIGRTSAKAPQASNSDAAGLEALSRAGMAGKPRGSVGVRAKDNGPPNEVEGRAPHHRGQPATTTADDLVDAEQAQFSEADLAGKRWRSASSPPP